MFKAYSTRYLVYHGEGAFILLGWNLGQPLTQSGSKWYLKWWYVSRNITAVCQRNNEDDKQRTGDELDLADHEPASVEVESNSECSGDEVTQRHRDWPGQLRQRVALVVVPQAGRRRVNVADTLDVANWHRRRGEDAHVAMKQVVGVDAHHAEVTHAIEPTHCRHNINTRSNKWYKIQACLHSSVAYSTRPQYNAHWLCDRPAARSGVQIPGPAACCTRGLINIERLIYLGQSS